MSCENCEESAYVIDKLAKLLAEIAVIVNGVEPHDTSWSYHDLPEKVRALKQAQQPAAPDVLPTITPEQARDKQCWKGMDGAIAFHLIERHADNWADIGVMMNAWLEANAQQPAALAVPEGWVAVPCRLTAENGGKFEFLGATFDGYRVPWGAVKAVHKAIVAWADQLAAAERKGVES